MHAEAGVACKALPTLGAGKGLLACVAALVQGEVRLLREALAAVLAGVWLLPRVRDPVPDQVRVVRKAFAALGADVLLLAQVELLVRDEVGLAQERIAAVRADVDLVPAPADAWQHSVGRAGEVTGVSGDRKRVGFTLDGPNVRSSGVFSKVFICFKAVGGDRLTIWEVSVLTWGA